MDRRSRREDPRGVSRFVLRHKDGRAQYAGRKPCHCVTAASYPVRGEQHFGGSLVVGAGSVKQTGEVYACVDDAPVPEIPKWLVDWLVKDIDKYWDAVDAEKAKKLALKEAEQKKYTPDERVQMRRKNLLGVSRIRAKY